MFSIYRTYILLIEAIIPLSPVFFFTLADKPWSIHACRVFVKGTGHDFIIVHTVALADDYGRVCRAGRLGGDDGASVETFVMLGLLEKLEGGTGSRARQLDRVLDRQILRAI